MTASTPQPAPLIRLNKFVQAPPQRVYDAWLDPEQLKQWWMPDANAACSEAQIDAQVGGDFRITLGSGEQAHIAVGQYLELDPPRKIVMSWSWEMNPAMAADSLITIELLETDNPYDPETPGTEIIFTHEKLNTAVERSEHTSGWWNTLRALGYYVRGVDVQQAMYGKD